MSALISPTFVVVSTAQLKFHSGLMYMSFEMCQIEMRSEADFNRWSTQNICLSEIN